MSERLKNFRDHVNELFSTPEALFIPHEVATGDDEDGTNAEGLPWDFDTRQFRKTLAWHIAHQPFGIVAGARQYQHAWNSMFEGYAGTSASGFATEVAAEEAVTKLDYLEDLYRDWNDGGRASGGAAQRIDAEFDRIRRELGDLPGVVASPSRLRTMLRHLTKVLHPGVLNDCFFQPAIAVCAKRAKPLGRPEISDGAVTVTNICLEAGVSRASYYRSPVAAVVKELLAAPAVARPEVEELRAEIARLKKAERKLRSEKAEELRELADTVNTYANHIQVLTLRNAELEEENRLLREKLERTTDNITRLNRG
ncbi:hypothetical protein ABZ815_50750 [Nonomuraea sp. NPDC047529]|uniref:hypothetical protein n=1 Tax=Nonomuraea sp. NPDC047529 TaxID=3155623 RepID=UPI0033E836B8